MAELNKVSSNQVGAASGVQSNPSAVRRPQAGETSFRDVLGQTKTSTPAQGLAELTGLPTASVRSTPIQFSNHAVERMQLRGIRYSPEQMGRIERAIDKAANKGSQNTLVLTDDSALIVSVNNRTVVTVMDKQNLKENVFTKIDSTVVL